MLTTVTSPGQTDEVTTRDFYYYTAFVTDQYGTHSPVSNMTSGTLNYFLGDVSNGVTPGVGDNAVNTADLSLLGMHYGLSGAAATAYSYLDVGPTTDHSVNGRPLTDSQINFEDLVMFALNFDVVSADGEYLGGVLATGLNVSADALFSATARLPRIELTRPKTVIARNTVESLQAGLIYGTAAMVDGIVERIRGEVGKATVVATGGLAEVVVAECTTVQHLEPWLTLEGLRIVYELNASRDE